MRGAHPATRERCLSRGSASARSCSGRQPAFLQGSKAARFSRVIFGADEKKPETVLIWHRLRCCKPVSSLRGATPCEHAILSIINKLKHAAELPARTKLCAGVRDGAGKCRHSYYSRLARRRIPRPRLSTSISCRQPEDFLSRPYRNREPVFLRRDGTAEFHAVGARWIIGPIKIEVIDP